jgi:hypothetical protein
MSSSFKDKAPDNKYSKNPASTEEIKKELFKASNKYNNLVITHSFRNHSNTLKLAKQELDELVKQLKEAEKETATELHQKDDSFKFKL